MCGGAIISDFIGVKRDRDLWFELDPSVDLLGLGGAAAAAAFNTPSSKELPPLSFEKFFSSDNKGTYILYQPLLSLSCSRLFLFPHHYTNVFIQFFLSTNFFMMMIDDGYAFFSVIVDDLIS